MSSPLNSLRRGWNGSDDTDGEAVGKESDDIWEETGGKRVGPEHDAVAWTGQADGEEADEETALIPVGERDAATDPAETHFERAIAALQAAKAAL